jgi:hypothetical protein
MHVRDCAALVWLLMLDCWKVMGELHAGKSQLRSWSLNDARMSKIKTVTEVAILGCSDLIYIVRDLPKLTSVVDIQINDVLFLVIMNAWCC